MGCRRTRAEIKAWSTATDGEKMAILARLPERAAAETRLLSEGGS
ncbi:hypothetical protein CCC_00646 [Paramagnetospirillum magnetotacticum MS-1]|uniref:Uncharacterized protein n=1 Tax=Paramagnetospirillum magnetotacticum MS-1 TaxID=272627 RepID=A0A0C2YSB8_PARME|nr:hypothetical protein CCC_00646 [Paramagnetospirillum magnetotacticum MS-1]